MGCGAETSWEQTFYDPIELSDGRMLRSLRDAGHVIQELPKRTQNRPEWPAAVGALLLVVECNGDPMLTRIGIMRALNTAEPMEPAVPRRKRALKSGANGDTPILTGADSGASAVP
ncbi:hypothetical protein [Bradyrhizobium sp. SZCCHNRI3043]|uniref:hypothetical protein n=1 Tax=Bradyrhizobium sp. SZCCHNRI3043 TaxID=3057292 RepID=UPI0028ED1EC7|nr:hypothetical protein [Bradyrhizobium sp. SZCCHNRI3043]